jgi:peptide/nickel transport system substrate-binding protein
MSTSNKGMPGILGRVDRRDFVKGASALALGAGISPLILPRRARAATKGGHLRVAHSHGSTTDTVVPGTYENGFTILLSYTAHGKLTIIGADNKLHGDLAKSWEGSDDAKKWVFKLRDAEFHNGQPVTASDVVASINHHRGESSTSAAKPIVAGIKDIKADGDKTIVVELSTGDADFPFILTDYQLCIGKATEGKIDWNDDGNRAGPYKLTRFDPGVRAHFEKAKNHWNPDIGHLASAEVNSVKDVAARQNALVSNEMDVVDRPDVRTVEQLSRRSDIKVEESSGFRIFPFTMFCDTPPFDNNDVRLALKYAVDREALLKIALLGHGSITNDHPITPAYRYYNGDIPQRPYDVDKAKFHLKKAGLSQLNVDLSTSVAAHAAAIDISVAYKEQAAPAGININVVREPADAYWTNVWLKKPFIASDWGGRPTEDLMFSVAFKAGAPWNDSHFNNEKFEKLLLEARSELNEAKRKEMYGEMQRIVHEEGGYVVPIIPNNIWAINTRVKHDEQISTAWEIDGWQFISRWWIES